MTQNFKFFLLLSGVFLAIDLYTWQGVKLLTQNWTVKSAVTLRTIYWGFTTANFFFFLAWRMNWIQMPKPVQTILFALVFIITIAKIFWCVFLLLDDTGRIFQWLGIKGGMLKAAEETAGIGRQKFLSYMGFGLGAAFVGSAVWGIAKGAHNYKVRRRELRIAGLPKAFDGLKIVQISDVHSGSFWSYDAVKRGIDMLNKEKADMVFFTGDLVNDLSDEVTEWKGLFSQIKAPLGVFSILGNHDYGDYFQWPDKTHEQKTAPKADKSHMSPLQLQNFNKLIDSHKEMGWDLLLDDNRVIEKDGQKIAIVGVENWSSKGRFPKYGNLDKAKSGVEDIKVKLLLSHDPSHWKSEVLKKSKHADIKSTFSGHTHGMQFGVDSRFYRWSPVKMLYKEWIDLYTEGDQHLYVNRGFGYLGFPGRMGIHPEITSFTLRSS